MSSAALDRPVPEGCKVSIGARANGGRVVGKQPPPRWAVSVRVPWDAIARIGVILCLDNSPTGVWAFSRRKIKLMLQLSGVSPLSATAILP